VGKRLRDLLNVAGSIFYETHFAPLLRMQGFFNEVALDLITANGTVIPTIANAAERRDEAGNVIFTRITIFRASERRRYERNLVEAQLAEREARRLAELNNAGLTANAVAQDARLLAEQETGELREQFIAVLGHDLRNPLAAIDAGRRFLEREPQDAKASRVLKLMGESVTRMSGLIDNLMDFARGRLGGGITVDITPGHQLEPTLLQVVDEIRAANPERKIETRISLSQPVSVDAGRIAQMFSNLLGNAMTHGSPTEPVTVEAKILDDHLLVSVSNGGEPIPDAVMERLFQPFYRGDIRPSAQGLGLGLYIASQIAQAHRGRLDVTSDSDATVFSFHMPYE
jgi:sigma-B regulation protein RsbU (phosphoserine phosphatase)